MNGKRYEIHYVQLNTVDVYTVAMGYHWNDIYPHLADFDRSVVRNRLWKRGEGIRESRARKKRR